MSEVQKQQKISKESGYDLAARYCESNFTVTDYTETFILKLENRISKPEKYHFLQYCESTKLIVITPG